MMPASTPTTSKTHARPHWLAALLPAILTFAAATALFLWIHQIAVLNVEQRQPGADNRPVSNVSGGGPAAGRLQAFDGRPSAIPGSWPCFRGIDGDAVSKERVPLLRQFPAAGPKTLWQSPLAEGHAGAAVWKGRVYGIDYDTIIQADAIRCLSLDDGKEIWRYSYPVIIPLNQGFTRTVPAIADGYVVTMGPKGHVACLNAQTGRFVWGIDLVKEYGAQVPPWYAGQNPRIENGRAIIAPGGSALMIAVDCATGKIVWQTENPDEWRMSHSSILPVTFAGKRMFVYCTTGGVVGVDAENGRILWKLADWKFKVIVPTPVDMGNGRIFFCGGYSMGSMVLHLKETDGVITPEIWSTVKAKVFGSHAQTPVFHRGVLYGVGIDNQLTCLDTNGDILWKSGAANTYGCGPFIIADGNVVILKEDGTLSFVEATPDSFNLWGSSKVMDGREFRGTMALIHGRLIVRERATMKCLDIFGKGGG